MGTRSLLRQWAASLAASLCVSMSGAMFVWMAPLMLRFTGPDSPIPMTTDDTSWLNAIIEISEGLATIPAGLLADRWGRKPLMLASGPIMLVSWILAMSTRSIFALYVVRIIQGIALAVPYTVTPMYMAEIAQPNLRGQLGAYFQVFFYVGTLYSYSTGPYFQYQYYLYLLCIPCLVFIGFYCLVPESPYYLLMVKKEDKAFQALSWLRADTDIDKEFIDIKQNVEEDMRNRGSWKDLIATKKDRMALLIVETVCLIRYTNGISSIVIYITQTLSKAGGLALNSDELSIILALALIVVTMSASFVADSVGRRPLLIISTIGATVFHSIVAIMYYLDEKTEIDVSGYMWVSYVSLVGFCIVSNIGLGPLMMIIQAEYFPSHTRGKAGGITGMVTALSCFISIKTYQIVDDYFGMYMNFVIFALISLAGTIIFWFVIHETAGKSLGQVQKTLRAANRIDETASNSQFSVQI